MTNIVKGTTFILSEGCYSDYRINGLFTALVDINLSELEDEFFFTHKPMEKHWTGKTVWDRGDFIKFLKDKNVAEPVKEYFEFWTSDYGYLKKGDCKIYAQESNLD